MLVVTRALSLSVLAALLAALLASSCAPTNTLAGDGGPGESEDAGPMPAAEYCETIAPFFCDYYLRCDRMAGVSSRAECEAVFAEQCGDRYEPRYVALEEAGLMQLSRSGLASCEEHLETVACDEQIRDLDGPCAGIWVGQQEEGGACGFDVESFVCAPGTACVLGLDFCGTCKPVVDDGQACGNGEVTCAADSTCSDDVCVARKKVGEACADGDRCLLGASCNDGFCRGPTVVAVGDACDQANRCPYKSHCEAGSCVEDGLIGDSCAGEADCASGWCASDDICQALFSAGTGCTGSEQCATGICADGVCAEIPGRCFN
jgi:hypothetical protein